MHLYKGRGSFASSIQLPCCIIAKRAKRITRFAETKIRDKLKPCHSLFHEQSDSETFFSQTDSEILT
jgi:hypothetical protein